MKVRGVVACSCHRYEEGIRSRGLVRELAYDLILIVAVRGLMCMAVVLFGQSRPRHTVLYSKFDRFERKVGEFGLVNGATIATSICASP